MVYGTCMYYIYNNTYDLCFSTLYFSCPLILNNCVTQVQVQTMRRSSNVNYSDEINILADGPHYSAWRYKAYIINGFQFWVKDMDNRRSTQNSGVTLKADTVSYASRKDNNPRVGAVSYYGVLSDIIEIRYTNDLKYVLFKCDWIDNNVGKKEDDFNFTLVNFKHLLYRDDRLTNEPFILASQAEQVWYVEDPLEPDWHVAVKMSQRDLFDMQSNEAQSEPYNRQELDENVMLHGDDVGWVRQEAEGTTCTLNNVVLGDVQMDECDDG